jgi:predicted MFS family arabinose efflux permease
LLFDSVTAAAIPSIVPKSRLAKANSWYEAWNSTAYTAGPAIAGYLLHTFSAVAVFAVNAALYLASTLLLKRIHLPRVSDTTTAAQSHFADIADGIRLLWKNKVQRTIALAAGLFNLFHTAFFTVFTLYAIKTLDFTAASYGTVISVVGAAGLAGALFAPLLIRAVGPRIALIGSLLVIAPLGIPMLLVEPLPFLYRATIIAACLAAWDFMIVVHVIVEQTLRQVMVDNLHLSRMTATTRFISWGADPIGALLGGLAATSQLGVHGTLCVCLAGFLGSAAMLLISRSTRTLKNNCLLPEA